MRKRIVFSLKNRGALVPFHYQFMIDQMVKGLLATGKNKKLADYNEYNFSSLKGQIRVGRGGICFFSRRVTLVFSTSSKEFMDYFIAILFAQESITIGNLQLIPEDTVSEAAVSFSGSMRFLCISPMVLMSTSFDDDEIKQFVSPETDEFSDLLYESTIERMEASGRYSADQLDSFYKFQLIADQEYLYRMEESGKKYARICPLYRAGNKLEVRGYTFPFTMYAPEAVQRFIYENGLGYFCDKGFGMIDLAKSKINHTSRHQTVGKNMPLYA